MMIMMTVTKSFRTTLLVTLIILLLIVLLLFEQQQHPSSRFCFYVSSFIIIIPIHHHPTPKFIVPRKQQQQQQQQQYHATIIPLLRYKPSSSDSSSENDNDNDNDENIQQQQQRNDDGTTTTIIITETDRFTNWIANIRRRPWTIRSDAVSNNNNNTNDNNDNDNDDIGGVVADSSSTTTTTTMLQSQSGNDNNNYYYDISQQQQQPKQQPKQQQQLDSIIIIDENFFLKNPFSRVLNIETILRYGEQQQQQQRDDDNDNDDDNIDDDNDDDKNDNNQKAIVNGKGGIGVIVNNKQQQKNNNNNNEAVIQKTTTTTTFSNNNNNDTTTMTTTTNVLLDIGSLIELSRWDKWVGGIWAQSSSSSSTSTSSSSSSTKKKNDTTTIVNGDGLIRQASIQLDSIVRNASSAVSSDTIQTLLDKSTAVLRQIYYNETSSNNNQTTTTKEKENNNSTKPLLANNNNNNNNNNNDFLVMATKIAINRGFDIIEATDRARETTAFAASLVSVADGLLRKGYVINNDPLVVAKTTTTRNNSTSLLLQNIPIILQTSKPLFYDYKSAIEINTYTPDIMKSAEMGVLAGAIYEETIPRTHALDHTIVTQGLTKDVLWMITDSIANNRSFVSSSSSSSFGGSSNSSSGNNNSPYEINSNNNDDDDDDDTKQQPFLVRTITVRGFDASDETVDREKLLINIVNGTSEIIQVPVQSQQQQQQQQQQQSLLVHSGLLQIARAIYKEIKPYIIGTAPNHKIILNGHSIGGSIAFLLLLLMTNENGSVYTTKRIARVYMFGSPPVVAIQQKEDNTSTTRRSTTTDGTTNCVILNALDLPTNIVYSFVQPWDPICRLFTSIDPLYPLIGDIGDDGFTAWVSGPYRTLRPITKAICEAWKGWPQFRDVFRSAASQSYVGVGIQHILLPEPTRYLADRFLAVNIPIPPIATIIRLSSSELHMALQSIFPLDTFEVSFIPQAIRSFVHHFYPAYGFPIIDYIRELERRAQGLPERTTEFNFSPDDEVRRRRATTNGSDDDVGSIEIMDDTITDDNDNNDNNDNNNSSVRKVYNNYGIDWKKMLLGLME